MLNRQALQWYAMIVCACFSGMVQATSFCEQTLKLLGVSGEGANGPCMFWVAEDLSGECGESRLIQVVIQTDHAGLIKSPLKRHQDWGCVGEAVALLEGPETVPLKKQDLSWQDEDGQIRLTVPDPNQALHERYLKAADTWCSSAREWNVRMGVQGTLCPSVDGSQLELLYAYAAGYYVNYRIKQVLYVPDRALLFVRTEQKQKAVGMDTMHGFLVLRVWPKADAQN
ncbi:MAG: hypothetical protein HQ515_13560 [Phycisphaeraceae bacterium]|nr:hypothetical protein [Phycisphaeraceae bacterium]